MEAAQGTDRRTQARLPRAAWPIYAGTLVGSFGNAPIGALLAGRMADAGLSATWPGMLQFAGMLGLIVGSLTIHPAIARFGHVRLYAFSALFVAGANLLLAVMPPPYFWMASRFAAGWIGIFMWLCTESWLQSVSPNAVRGRMMSIYMMVHAVGMGSGQLMLTLFPRSSDMLFLVSAVLVATSILPILSVRAHRPQVRRPEFISPLRIFAMSPIAVTGGIMAGATTGSFIGLGPVYAVKLEPLVGSLGVFMFVLLGAGSLLQWPIGRLSDRVDRLWLLMVMYGCVAVMSVGAVWAQTIGSLPLLLMVAAVGGSMRVIYPISASYLSDSLTSDQRVAATGGMMLAWALGAMVVPLPGGMLMDAFGPTALLWYVASLSLVGLTLTGVLRGVLRVARARAGG